VVSVSEPAATFVAKDRRMAWGRASLAFRDRMVLGRQWAYLSVLFFCQRRMAPSSVSSAPRCCQCGPTIRVLRQNSKISASRRFLQRPSAPQLQRRTAARSRDGAIGSGDLQARSISFLDTAVRWLRRCPRGPSGGSLFVGDLRRDSPDAGLIPSSGAASDGNWRSTWPI